MKRSFIVSIVLLLLVSSFASASGLFDRDGCIGAALNFPDGSAVSLDCVQVSKIITHASPQYYVCQEIFSPQDKIIMLVTPSPLLKIGAILDVQGSLTTLDNGFRALTNVQYWAYTDEQGNILCNAPIMKGINAPAYWAYKTCLSSSSNSSLRANALTATTPPTTPTTPTATTSVTITLCSTITQVKSCTSGYVEIKSKPITAKSGTVFTIQQDGDTTQTIDVNYSAASSLNVGDRVIDLVGMIDVDSAGNKVIDINTGLNFVSPDDPNGSVTTAAAGSILFDKTLPNNTANVSLTGRIITRVFPDYFYIEDTNRAYGIKVVRNNHTFVHNTLIDVTGTMQTDSNYERYLYLDSYTLHDTSNINPLGMPNRSLGGGDLGYDSAIPVGQRGITGANGFNNIGLFVRAWGKVSEVGTSYFKINDGSGVDLEVAYSPGNLTAGNYIAVTGISSCEVSGSDLLRVIRTNSAADITKTTGLVAPAVTDDGSTIASSSSLHASWTSPDYGVNQYRYKITSVDSQQQESVLVDWTNTSSAEATYSGGLTVGNTYYFHVQTKTSLSDWSPEGISDGITCKSVVFVKSGSNGTGTSWSNALGTVDAGLAAATSGGEVWVAQGTYTVPTTPKTFTMVSGAGLYGGFNGDESSREKRSPKNHETILDGNKLGSVVAIPANADANTIIDGFTIRNGIGTIVSSNRYGGGIYCSSGSPTISHNKIIYNYIDGIGEGGGIYIGGGSPTITYNVISGNDGLSYGGGIYLANATATIANNVISANGAGYGGGIYCNSGTTTIVNNTIALNDGSVGGGIYCNNSVTITGNIVAYNCSGIYCNTSITPYPTINNNCLHNATADYTKITLASNNKLDDPKFARVSYGDFHIQPDSPCIGYGSNEAAQTLTLDIDGNPRKLPSSGNVDMGAYESDGTTYNIPDRIYRVIGTGGNDNNDGSDWTTNALATLQAAIDKATQTGGEVWVKGIVSGTGGTYSGQFNLRPFVYLYGGFGAIDGETKDNRNWLLYTTTLDGMNTGRVLAIHGGYDVVNTVDAFDITNGYLSGNGAGILCSNSSPLIQHNNIYKNTARGSGTGYGGGIYCLNGTPVINRNVIGKSSFVNAANYGGGIATMYSPGATISANRICCNTANYDGGGIYSFSIAKVFNNYIYNNTASHNGGGIFQATSSTISNNTITKNKANTANSSFSGGGIYIALNSWDNTLKLANNIFAYNSDGISSCDNTTSTLLSLIKNCVYQNTSQNYSTNITSYGSNISGNPKLDTTLYLYLSSGSSCIGSASGQADPTYSPADDLAGNSRPMGGYYDIGAEEY